jgi:hypothetical protein
MDKYLTPEEFVAVISTVMKNTLERDFGSKKAHVVDLMTHATTGMEWMYQFVDAYGGIEYERHLQAKAPVEDIEPIVKSSKKKK